MDKLCNIVSIAILFAILSGVSLVSMGASLAVWWAVATLFF